MVEEILNTRLMVKKSLKANKADKVSTWTFYIIINDHNAVINGHSYKTL